MKAAMRQLFRKTKLTIVKLLYGLAGRRRTQVHPTGRLSIHPSVQRIGGRIVVGSNSALVLEAGVNLCADLYLGENCRVVIGQRSRIQNAVFRVAHGASIQIGAGAMFDSPDHSPNQIVVEGGSMVVAEHVRVQAEILVRFGGRLTIGRYTGIGYGSEIRCEEQIDIGEYGLFSYDVCIYDSNTHSTDWQERRQMIERMVATGAGEDQRPSTKPVRIGDDVWIGKGATILKGCQIGNRCIVGIRTVVGGSVYEDDSVIVSPAPRRLTR